MEYGFTIEIERKHDGRWLPELSEPPGALGYRISVAKARTKAQTLAKRDIAGRRENEEG
jgi:hypothetical protein